MHFGRRKHENRVRGRLFERFEQRVERRAREHVNLVDDVHFVLARNRRVRHVVHDFADLIDAVVRRRVKFDNVDIAAG